MKNIATGCLRGRVLGRMGVEGHHKHLTCWVFLQLSIVCKLGGFEGEAGKVYIFGEMLCGLFISQVLAFNWQCQYRAFLSFR